MRYKKKAGVVSDIVNSTGGLVINVIVIFVMISTIVGAGLLTANSSYANATDRLANNLTAGVDNVSGKIPTVLLVAAVVILFGAIVLLYTQFKRMGVGTGGGSL